MFEIEFTPDVINIELTSYHSTVFVPVPPVGVNVIDPLFVLEQEALMIAFPAITAGDNTVVDPVTEHP